MMRAINAGSKILSTFEKSLIGVVSTVLTVADPCVVVTTTGSSKLCVVTVVFSAGVTVVVVDIVVAF